jgi:hypothetical protein
MSDQAVVQALDDMERMLEVQDLSTSTLAAWQKRYDAAIASAERGSGWAEIAQRSRHLSRRLDLALVGLLADQEAVRKRLHLITVGRRALRGYAPAGR